MTISWATTTDRLNAQTKSWTHRISYAASMAILSPGINLPESETGFYSKINIKVYVHRLPFILYDDLQWESLKSYGPQTSITWLQLLRKQTKTDSYTASEISLDSLKLPAPEVGDFVESILLQKWEQLNLHSPIYPNKLGLG